MIVLPIFLSSPPLVVGIPVFLANEVLAPEIPTSLFQEKENPYLPLKPSMNSIFYCKKTPSKNR